jgi:Icc-related predicted phosphoesterase
MKLMIVGDTHGNVGPLAHKIKIAKIHGIKHMFVVGDFGLWPGMGGTVFLDDINRIANNEQVDVWAIPGNHEDHDQWEWYFTKPSLVKMHGFANVRTRIWLSPKVNFFRFGDKRFGVAGGAVSIDRQWRREGTSYWPNEVLSEKELTSILSYNGDEVDYLLTHDCSNRTPWGFKLVPDPASQEHREKIDRVLDHIQPKVHFHGHMHHKYDWVNPVGRDYTDATWVRTYGLDCDGQMDSWGILDTADDSFVWGSDIRV